MCETEMDRCRRLAAHQRRVGASEIDDALAPRLRTPVEPQLEVRQPAGLPGRGQRPYQVRRPNAGAAQDGEDEPRAPRHGGWTMSEGFGDVHVVVQAGGKGMCL